MINALVTNISILEFIRNKFVNISYDTIINIAIRIINHNMTKWGMNHTY